jgi:hypothetical protein
MRFAALPLFAILALGAAQEPPKVDFVRDVQPLFKASCLKCHGAEKPKGQFRLDARGPALKGGVGGVTIVPGRGAESLLIKLLLDADEEVRMPQKAPALPKEKIDLLRRWIDEGAVWPDSAAGEAAVEQHWAYVKPVRRETPPDRHPIDHFILERLKKEGIEPSPAADRATLVKRLTYDLLGLPPTPEEVDAFLREGDREKLVDRLLASPHFGERWGRHWLDQARYADSDGYEKDNPRPDAWRYRDWVIDAVNDDLPFDQFTVRQLAGDLLPDAGAMTHLATAFHRQTLTNTEGGVDKEQFRVEAVFDRTETTGAVWLGLTVGCARCHNHKFDRISQQEYYQIFAFFNNGDETTREVPVSEEALAKYETEKAAYDAKRRGLEERLAKERPAFLAKLPAWEGETRARLREEEAEGVKFAPLEILSIKPLHEVTFKKLDDGSWLAGGADAATETYVVSAKPPAKPVTGIKIEVLPDKSLPGQGPGRTPHGNFVLSEFKVDGLQLKDASADFSQQDWGVAGAIDGNPKTGWAVSPQMGKGHHATFLAAAPTAFEAPLVITLDQQYGERHTIGRFRLSAMTGTKPPLALSDDVRKALAADPAKRSPAQLDLLLEQVAEGNPLVKQLQAHRKTEPKAPVMSVRVLQQRAKDPRVTKLFHRGEFLQPKQEVKPGTLASLHPLKPRGETPDRLDLALWIVDPANPLTARVMVNQIWSHLFGQGLVRTSNDFGVRGERPSHPELLDWLATEYLRLGWSRKALIRRIVTSEAYGRSSIHRPELADRDPRNDLLYRQNRFRVEGEIVRDLALAVSGLLSKKVGGPSVFPPMPADIAALSYAGNFKWKNSEGEDRYRRGMYTYFKRTSPYPHLMNFDCPDSNTTCVQRRTSNTPLQALSMLNNEVFVEAAAALGKRLASMPDGLSGGFRLCVARNPSEVEVSKLKALLEAGGWTAVARVLLNLDEFITRE